VYFDLLTVVASYEFGGSGEPDKDKPGNTIEVTKLCPSYNILQKLLHVLLHRLKFDVWV